MILYSIKASTSAWDPIQKVSIAKIQQQFRMNPSPQLGKSHVNPATSAIWIIVFFCVLFALLLSLGSQPTPTVTNTKLFPLFDNKKYHQLEKKLDAESRVALQGDDEQGLGVFLDQYINERSDLVSIRRRDYSVGKNLEYSSNNIFAKGYYFVKNSLFKNDEQEKVLWVIESKTPLNLKDMEDIHKFTLEHPADKFLIAAKVIPTKASKNFKIIHYQELPKQLVSELLFKEHKLDKVNAQNLLSSFGGDLQQINELLQDSEVESKFVESYKKETEELESLLESDTKQVKSFFDKMCKDGKMKSAKSLSYIPKDNNLVRLSEGAYHWSSIRSIFAFSDKFDVECKTGVVIEYVPPAPVQEDTPVWIASWFSSEPAQEQQQAEVEVDTKETKVTKKSKKAKASPKKSPKKGASKKK